MTFLHDKGARIGWGMLAVLAVYLVGHLATRTGPYHWDFSTYYHAAKIWADGGDPYDVAAIAQAAGKESRPFLYPPVTLPMFRLLTFLPYSSALETWLFLKVLLLIPLLYIWWRWFVPLGRDCLFGLFLLLALGGPIYLDLQSANVTIIEQLLLWIGFACFLKRRMVLFCLGVVLAATFKGTPLLFLGLLFLPGVQRRIVLLIGALGLFGLIQGIGYLMNPAQFWEYLHNAATWDERGQNYNPSILAALKDIWDPLRDRAGSAGVVDLLTFATYAVIIVTVLWISWRGYNRLAGSFRDQRLSDEARQGIIILLAIMAFALIVPRLKVYTLMMVLPAAYYVVRSQAATGALLVWMILLSLSSHTPFPLDERFVAGIGWYYPLIMLFVIWGVWMFRLAKGSVRPEVPREP